MRPAWVFGWRVWVLSSVKGDAASCRLETFGLINSATDGQMSPSFRRFCCWRLYSVSHKDRCLVSNCLRYKFCTVNFPCCQCRFVWHRINVTIKWPAIEIMQQLYVGTKQLAGHQLKLRTSFQHINCWKMGILHFRFCSKGSIKRPFCLHLAT